MDRRCATCSRDLRNEPAIRGLRGSLCFPCRVRYDVAGGQEYVLAREEFNVSRAAWDAHHQVAWILARRLLARASTLGGLAAFGGYVTIGVAVFVPMDAKLALGGFSAAVALVLWLAQRRARERALGLNAQPPPLEPHPNSGSLTGRPELEFDATFDAVGDRTFDEVQGYPPDWAVRKDRVRKRDDHVCRLCGSTDGLHVHHVLPVSFGGIHSPQNLVTLCRRCHMSQGYWQHQALVRQNIRANRRYPVQSYVRSDGTLVRAHSSRVGRRGRFWSAVRRERQSVTATRRG